MKAKNKFTAAAVVMMAGLAACSGGRSQASAVVEVGELPAGGGSSSSSAHDPAAPRKTVPRHGIVARLIVDGCDCRVGPRLRSADTLRLLRALRHPITDDYRPQAAPAPSQSLIDALTRLHPDGKMPDPPGPADIGAITDAMPRIIARDEAVKAADAAYRDAFQEQPRALFIEPPRVSMKLRLRNLSHKTLQFRVSGDEASWRMQLRGPGAVHVLGGGDPTERYLSGRLVRLEPGGTVDLPIEALRYGTRASELAAYWTESGDYQLSVSLETTLLEGPSGDAHRSRRVEIVAPAVALRIR